MKALIVLALALSCLLSQLSAVEAFAGEEQYKSETLSSSAGTMALNESLPGVGFTEESRSLDLSNEAIILLNAARYDEAEAKLRTAISLDPNLACAHCNLGLLLNKTGRAQEAIPHLELARAKAPDAPAPVVTLAASYQLSGNLPKAINLYSEYVQRFPNSADCAVIQDIISHLLKESTSRQNTEGNYHWAKHQLKVFIHDAGGVSGFRTEFNSILQESFLSWSATEALSFEFVDQADQADIECVWTDNVDKLSSIGEGGEAVLRHRGPIATHATITLLTNRIVNQHAEISNGEIRTLCLHEIGHSLGMMIHSTHPDDVMFCTLSATANPSSNDFNNLQALYSN